MVKGNSRSQIFAKLSSSRRDYSKPKRLSGLTLHSYPFIVSPPDTLITCPVMNCASSLARNATMPGMSSG